MCTLLLAGPLLFWNVFLTMDDSDGVSSVPFAAVELCSPVQLLVLLVSTNQVNLDEIFNEVLLHRDMLRELRLKKKTMRRSCMEDHCDLGLCPVVEDMVAGETVASTSKHALGCGTCFFSLAPTTTTTHRHYDPQCAAASHRYY